MQVLRSIVVRKTLWRKLNGKSAITESDALAIERAVEMAEAQ
jgi:hypothetical protein